MTPLRTIAATALALCIARGAGADTFKCGADALNAAVEPKPAATATATAPAPAETAATNTAAAAQAPQDSELERLLAAVKADEFPNDKARDVTLAKAKAILVDAEYRLPADVASPAKVLEDLVDAASMPEVAYSVLLQRDNAALFAVRDQQGVRDWLYGTVAGSSLASRANGTISNSRPCRTSASPSSRRRRTPRRVQSAAPGSSRAANAIGLSRFRKVRKPRFA